MHAYSGPWHSQNSLFKRIQGYLGIFRDIDAYSATLNRRPTREERGGLPTLYENRKKGPDFGKKCRDFVNHWVTFFHHFS